MNSFISRLSVLLVLVLAGGGLFQPTQAQLQKIEQTVFGMDCAPCAHAMEQSLGAMEGVETVTVRLNDGLATIELTETNSVAYRGVRTTVSDGGFAAKKALLEAKGTLRRTDDGWILETPVGEQFVLQEDDQTASGEGGLQDLKPNQQVTVTGRIPSSSESGDTRWPLHVQQVHSAT